MSKFYQVRQGNPLGYFEYDEVACPYVIVEAKGAAHAESILNGVGIYDSDQWFVELEDADCIDLTKSGDFIKPNSQRKKDEVQANYLKYIEAGFVPTINLYFNGIRKNPEWRAKFSINSIEEYAKFMCVDESRAFGTNRDEPYIRIFYLDGTRKEFHISKLCRGCSSSS